jgi:hypothetical protein
MQTTGELSKVKSVYCVVVYSVLVTVPWCDRSKQVAIHIQAISFLEERTRST